jgi:hypothetical protein
MEARSQLRHRPTIEAKNRARSFRDRGKVLNPCWIIFAHISGIVNARSKETKVREENSTADYLRETSCPSWFMNSDLYPFSPISFHSYFLP